MPVYMIGYDLHPSSGEDYDKLYTTLETVGCGYWDCLELTWLVITEKTPAQIRDALKQHLKKTTAYLSCGTERGLRGTGKDDCRVWLEDKL